jgi:hypothetical protein
MLNSELMPSATRAWIYPPPQRAEIDQVNGRHDDVNNGV